MVAQALVKRKPARPFSPKIDFWKRLSLLGNLPWLSSAPGYWLNSIALAYAYPTGFWRLPAINRRLFERNGPFW